MRAFILGIALSAASGGVWAEQTSFEQLFRNRTMRIDYYHVGDGATELFTLDQVYEQGAWAGSTTALVDELNLGRYMVRVFDLATNRLIFSRSFDSYFGEYRSTDAAAEGVKRAYHESVLMPMPIRKIQFTLEARDKGGILHRVFDTIIDPDGIDVNREGPRGDTGVITFHQSGDPHRKVDVLFLAEGYTSPERGKFESDVKRFVSLMFSQEPYASRKDMFNVRGAFKASAESGCDEPSHGSYRRTSLGASFDSLGVYRYLLVEDNRAIRDIAAHAPYDALYILVNTKRYGGGGIYNLYCTTTADNAFSDYVFLHEFGHSFAGLADEYYSSTTAYNDFYPKETEPLEPNITALLDAPRVKWQALVTPGTAIPTPWEKADYDKMDSEYQARREELNQKIAKTKREGGEAAELQAESDRMAEEHARKVDHFLGASAFSGRVGACEGAGYTSKGLYRPSVDCIMFTKGVKPFCRVCAAAIARVIDSYAH